MPNTKLRESAKPPIGESEEAKTRANRDFADRMAQKAVEGFRNLTAQKKAAREAQNPAA